MPTHDEHGIVPARGVQPHGHYVARGCFVTPFSSSEAVLESLPRCYTYVR